MSPALALPTAEPVAPGGPPGFDRVFAENAPFVWRALGRLGVEASDVEDVCQEVFMIVHHRLDTFEARSSLRTWLYGICIRAAREHRRKRQRRREELIDAPEQSVPAPQLEELQRRRAAAQLAVILDRLDDDKRAVFVLFELEGLTMKEIAEAVGCPLQTAYARLYAARELFEAALRRAGAQQRSTP